MADGGTTRPGPRSDDLIRRLRAWPLSSWRHGARVERTHAALQALADLTQPGRPVPDVGVHALPDQLAVLLREASGAGVPAGRIDEVLDALRADLRLR